MTTADGESADEQGATETARPPRARRGRSGASDEGSEQVGELSIDEQADVVASFLTGLADAFGVPGTSTVVERVDDDTVEVRLSGGDLGLLIGPKGQTLHTAQELARTVVQRRGGGTQEGRIRIDIAGYRQRRREALERFTHQVAATVLETGTQKALEPMNAADRKVVHDTANTIDGVRTISQGEEPRRRVVLLPD
jgi:spoIIIJ-associated protein